MYPLLKENARLIKREQGVFVHSRIGMVDELASPAAGVILSLCCGSLSVEQITGMVERTLHISADFTKAQIEHFDRLLTWFEKPLPEKIFRYQPTEFVYRALPYPPERLGWPDDSNGQLDRPVELLFSLVHNCNFRCVYCFNAGGERNTETMPTEKWLELVDQAKAMDVQRITITGGEPTLHSGFRRIVDRIVSYGIEPDICTNGYDVDDEFVSWLSALKVPYVQISMDSADEAVFDALTQRKGGFRRVTAGIRKLVLAGIQVIIKAVVMPSNLESMPDLALLADEMGAAYLNLDRFDISGCGRGNQHMLVTDEMLDHLRDLIHQYRIDHPERKMVVNISNNRICWRGEQDIVSCGAFKRSLTVLPNGDISCCEKLIDVPEAVAGNVRQQSLEEIWHSPRIREIIYTDESKYDEKCLACEYLHECRGGCYSLKLSLDRDMYGIDPRCFKSGEGEEWIYRA